MNGRIALRFVTEAQRYASFQFSMLQSDHGPEFSSWFVARIQKNHRYTRIGKPNDNSHIERFNRTIQEECLDQLVPTILSFRKAIPLYLKYYNTERLHMGINFKTPSEMFPRY